jgi:hypothetical protein
MLWSFLVAAISVRWSALRNVEDPLGQRLAAISAEHQDCSLSIDRKCVY